MKTANSAETDIQEYKENPKEDSIFLQNCSVYLQDHVVSF